MTALVTGRAGIADPPLERTPWLALVEATLREAASTRWNATPPVRPPSREAGAPWLAGARVSFDRRTVLAMVRRLRAALPPDAAPPLASVDAVLAGEDDGVALFVASVSDEPGGIEAVARRGGADVAATAAVAALLPVPFLQACRRRAEGELEPAWRRGHCPLCGSWPAFAEVLEVEGTRRFRCGPCGAGWPAPLMACAFCGTADYHDLVRLVPEDHGRSGVVEACTRCSAYVKSFTALQTCSPLEVMLRDLATAVLDIAALDEGYARHEGRGHPLGLQVAVR